MQRVTKYMTFILEKQKPKTQVWGVRNNQSGFWLGTIEWYPQWRQYCFSPQEETMFNNGCLQTLKEFLDELNTRKSIRD